MKESVDKIIHSSFLQNNMLVVINAHNFVEVWDMGQSIPERK
jgi:energy-converting hydrogenase Eha subunit C